MILARLARVGVLWHACSMLHWLDAIVIPFLQSLYGAMGYVGVAVAMAIESAGVPLPSELILPFAGFLVADPTQIEPLTGAPWNALLAVIAAEPLEAKMRAAKREGKISGEFGDQLAADALAKGVLTQDEADALARAKSLRRKVIMVDDFPKDFGRSEFFQTTQPVSFEALRR